MVWATREEEYTYGGPAEMKRPLFPKDVSDAEWANYLYFHDNINGVHMKCGAIHMVAVNGSML